MSAIGTERTSPKIYVRSERSADFANSILCELTGSRSRDFSGY